MKSIFFKSLNLELKQYEKLVSDLENYGFDNDNGDGVQVIEQGERYIKCIYYYETMSSQKSYNPETGEFDKIEFKRIETVPFIVDYEYKTLDIIGNKAKCSKVVEFVGKILKFKVAIGDIQTNPIKVLQTCEKSNIEYSVSRVKISDYIFFDNIVGNCVLNLTGYDKSYSLLKEYEKQIVNFSATISFDKMYSMTFYKSGAISISKDDIDIEIIRTLKIN